MKKLHTPAVPDLARISGYTVDEAVEWLISYYNREVIPWNYRVGTRCIKEAYKGFNNISQLLSGCEKERIKQSKECNKEIVRLGAPIAFGRSMQVFDLPARRFSFGRDLHAGYRIPFFFIENRKVNLYFLQPRKNAALSYDEICMVATIHKKYLLDIEFFGQKFDVEYVDLSVDCTTKKRDISVYSLGSLELWSESRLIDRLTLIAEALEKVQRSGRVNLRSRFSGKPDSDMPLFD